MAKFDNTVVSITINSKQAKQELKMLKNNIDSLKDSISEAQKRMNDPSRWKPGEKASDIQKDINRLQKELKGLEAMYKRREQAFLGVNDVLKNISTANYNEAVRTQNILLSRLKNIRTDTEEGVKEYQKILKKLQEVRDKVNKFSADTRGGGMSPKMAKEVMKNLDTSSYEDIKNAITTVQQLQRQVEPGSTAWKNYGKQIADASLELKKWDDQAKRTQMLQATKGDLGKMSEQDLQQQLRYWDGLVNGVGRTNVAITQYKKVLDSLRAEQDKRAGRVMTDIEGGNLGGSIAQMQQRLKMLQEYRATIDSTKPDAYLRIDAAIEKLNKGIKESQAGFMSFNDAMAKAANLDTFDGTLEDLEKIQKVIKEGMSQELNLSDPADIDRLKQATTLLDNIAKKQQEMARINAQDKINSVSSNLDGSSAGEIQEAVQLAKDLQKASGTTKAEYMDLAKFIADAEEKLKSWNDEVKRSTMETQLQRVGDLSKAALEEQKKYWQEVVNGTEKGDAALISYKQNLEKVLNEEKTRIQQSGKDIIANFNTGSWNKTIGETREAVKQLKDYRDTLKSVGDAPALEEVDKAIEGLSEKIRQTEKGFISFGDAMAKAANLNAFDGTLEDLEKIKKVIQEGMSKELNLSNPNDVNRLKQATTLLDDIAKKQQDMARINAQEKVDAVQRNISGSSAGEIEEAIRLAKDLQKANGTTGAEYIRLSKFIADAEAQLKSWNDEVKRATMEKQFTRLTSLSKSALEEQSKYWQEVFNNAEKGTAKYIQAERKLKKIREEQLNRSSYEAGSIMGNLNNSSMQDIERAIKMTEQLRDAHSRGSHEYEIYSEEIKKAKEYLQSYVDMEKKIDMEDKWNNLTTLSANALAEQKKYWQDMVNGAKMGSKELLDYKNKLKEVQKEESRRSENKYYGAVTHPERYSVSEVQEAIKAFEKLRDEHEAGSPAWNYYGEKVEDAKEALKRFNDEAKRGVMTLQLTQLNTLSAGSLSEQKKYWQEMVNNTELGNAALTDYQKKLKLVIDEENRRAKLAAEDIYNKVNSGAWNGTIGETQKAYEELKKYRELYTAGIDDTKIEEIDKAMQSLSERTKQAEQGFMSYQEALNVAAKIKIGSFDGNVEEIEKAKKALEEYRKKLKLTGDAGKLEEVNEALNNLSRSAELGGKNLKNLDKTLSNLKKASVEDLQTAAKQLEEKLKGATRATKEYADTAADLRRVNRELERARKEWEGQESLFVRMTKRLTVYMAAYGSLSAITDYIKEIGKANLELSDTMSDVQKTTGLTADQVARLGNEIDDIDTRTTQQQLYELAAAAGQMGLKSETDILGFVKAANMITVSLNELGTEGTTSLMKIATLTGEALQGTEKALMSIGSAINELTASSAATAGPIVDLMNRMGGIAAQSGITSAQMAAIGATADALGQSVEITGTSMNKFLSTLLSSSDQVAYALNMDAKALRNMINTGKTMDAVIAVFERMNDMGGLGQLAGVMGELGSEGARMTQVLAAMAQRVDFLKAQVELSTDAYAEATSIQNEYNVKNENALAILQRMGNAIKETFVNSGLVQIMTSVLRSVYEFFKFLGKGTAAAKATAYAISALTAALIANRIAWVRNMQAMSGIRQLVVLRRIYRDITAAIVAKTIAIKANIIALGGWIKSLFSASTASAALATAGQKLKAIWASNWITLVVGAIAGLAALIIKTATYVSEAAKATAKYNRELQEEKDKVDTLFNSLKRLNSTDTERAKTISKINDMYGEYLGFMIDEKDSADKLLVAHKLINAELQKRMALSLQSTLEGTASTNYAEKYEKASSKISDMANGEGQYKGRNWVGLFSGMEMNNLIDKIIADAVQGAIVESADGKFRELSDINQKDVLSKIQSGMLEKFMTSERDRNAINAFYNVSSTKIVDLLEERQKYVQKILDAERVAGLELERYSEDTLKAREETNATIKKNYDDAAREVSKLEKELNDATAEAEKYKKDDNSEDAKTARKNLEDAEKNLRDHYTKMADNANDYADSTKKLMEDFNNSLTEDEKTRLSEEITLYKKHAKDVTKLIPGMDPWGKDRDVKDWKEFADIVENIDTSSATALAAAYKKIKEDTANIPDDVNLFYKMFEGTGLQEKLNLEDPNLVANTIFEWEKQIREKLKTKFHRNTSLGFIFKEDDGDDKSAKRKAKENYNAAIAALEAYFNERETLIRENGMKEGKTQVQINQELERLETEKLNDEIQLRKLLLEEYYKESTFDPSKYKGVISGTDYFKEKNMKYLAELREQLEKWGVAMEDGMKKQLTDRMVKLAEQALKLREKINKILLEDNFTEQVMKQYHDTLQELGLLFGLTEGEISATSEKEGERRLAYMREWSKNAYQMNEKHLYDLIEQNESFSKWRIGRTYEDYEALLIQLRKFNDDVEEAERKAAERRKKIFDKSNKGLELKEQSDKNIKKEEDNVDMWERFQGLDLSSEEAVHKAQIDMYKEKIEASQAYIEQIKREMRAERVKLAMTIEDLQRDIDIKKKAGKDTAAMEADLLAAQQQQQSLIRQERLITFEEEQKIEESRQGMLGHFIAIEETKLNEAKKYTDAILEFSGQMGEAAFGEVEDRKEAAKQLIKTLLTTLKDWIQIKTTELVMEKLFAQQSTAISGQQTIQELSMTGSKATADVIAGTASATAKEVGSKGWIGLAVGAAIGAALSALLGLAMGAISKSKSEVASVSGAGGGKLATGMLTYAEGNYPVLGNDGQVYNAKYEGAGMKTGIYRGGAHFGIFSEKKPEAIIDGDTTQRLIMNHPDIWKAIVTLSKSGRLPSGYGMRTFATGNINELTRQAQNTEATVVADNQAQMAQMQATIERNNQVMAQLTTVLAGGIHAKMYMYGEDGEYKKIKKAEKFAKRTKMG